MPDTQDVTDKGPLLLKAGLPLVVVVALAVLDPQATRAVAQATVSSPQAIAIVVGVVAAIVGWSALTRRWARDPWAQAGLVLLPLAVLGAVWVAPYYQEGEVVDDDFPVALAAPSPATATPTPATPDRAGEDPPPPPAPPVVVHQPGEDGEIEPVEVRPGNVRPGAVRPTTVPAVPEPTPTPTPEGPVELSRGSFVGLDGHVAHGEAAIYDLGDGTMLVRLEEVDLQNVPAPVVHLVPAADATAPTEGSIDLGVLKGTQGNQNYEVPPDVDLTTGAWTVLVWCETFASPVGAASQA